jgi:GH35 family endo-1,4-beta-xylanase
VYWYDPRIAHTLTMPWIEYGDAKHKGALRIVRLVKSWGVKIDGVGLQGHM